MKVIYESYRRHRNNSSSSSSKNSTNNSGSINNNNNGNNHKNGHGQIEICHSLNDFFSNGATTNNGTSATDNSPTGDYFSDNNGSNRQQQPTPTSTTWRHIISVDSLLINKELGVGEFGVVQQGVWTNEDGQRIQVAIKCLSSARLENSRIEFLKEATIMHSICHEHIVTLYGVVLEPSVMLITELAPLRSLLECLKEPALNSHFPLTSLCTFAAQIADGMSYLESKRLIHRDLAARNILVFSKTKVKISDFGLSRALGVGKDYYQSNFNVNLKLPIAWCAPECINYLKFTSQSDVWAYGVTLWEMFSFGFQPWAALTGQQILEAIDKPNYQRLEKPECCPKEYYQLMLKCWTHEPNLRPKFSEIVQMLPDCKPELLQAIRDSGMVKKDFLMYKCGDIVTVIDKHNTESMMVDGMLVWKGVTNDRKTGLFNPSDFVAYLGQNLPSSTNPSSHNSSSNTNHYSASFVQSLLSGSSNSNHTNNHHSNNNHSSSLASTITSTVLQSSKFLRGFLESKSNHASNSPHGNRKNRLRPDMISRPQGDLKHTGHVGADGVFFGDVSFLDGKYQHVPENNHNDAIDSKQSNPRKLTISNPITNFSTRNNSANDKVISSSIYSNCNHEYHEISDDDGENNIDNNIDDDLGGPLESPPFEVLDFGPSLMEEVFRELDHIKPDLSNEAGESETAINENTINVKNEVRELNLKISKESNLKKKQSTVKPISEAEQNELDSAIAMARTMMLNDNDNDALDMAKNHHHNHDSPKTPNSPNKRKFSFKFPTGHRSPKSERRTFSEETESIGNIIESITPAAKEAYMSLVDRGVSSTVESNKETPTGMEQLDVSPTGGGMMMNELDNTNPLRMLRTAGIGKVLRPKVRGNRSFSQPRLPVTTAQTAGLARVASSRSPLGIPGNVAIEDQSSLQAIQQAPPPPPTTATSSINVNNALPLPPRDRTVRPLIQLKTHQRRHPLVIPTELTNTTAANNEHLSSQMINSYHGESVDGQAQAEPSSTNYHDSLRRHVIASHSHHTHHPPPILKPISCPQAPAAFLNKNQNNKTASNGSLEISSDKPLPPPKPNRTYLSDDLTESIESEIQKAFDNIKIGSSSTNNITDISTTTTASAAPATNNTNSITSSTSNITKPPIYEETYTIHLNTTTPSTFSRVQPPITTITNNNTSSFFSTEKPKEITTSVNSSEISTTTGSNSTTTKRFTTTTPTTTTSMSSSKHRNIDSDEVRVMQKVLTNEINLTAEECAKILDSTDWDIHRAIKCIRLRQQLRTHNIHIDCDWAQMLSKFNWNIRQASNYLIATHGVPEDTTEV